jgi:dTDP-4-dehydrorhamnose reductase
MILKDGLSGRRHASYGAPGTCDRTASSWGGWAAEALHALPLPLLITGITGVAGLNAFTCFADRFPGQVIGVRPPQTWRFVAPGVAALDTANAEGLTGLFRRHGFRSVLNATGNCALKSCELAPTMAEAVNVTSAAVVAQAARTFGARLVHLSSDLVYSGVGSGNYVETDPVDPVTVYGKTMAAAERVVAEADPSAAVLRISLPMGPSFNRHAGAVDWIQSRFRAGRPATLYFDEVRSCTYVTDLNRVFAWFLAGDRSGVFHLGGPRGVTLYQIGQIVNRTGGYDPGLLRGCPRSHAGPVPPRAGNVTMASDKLINALGEQPFRPWPADPELWPGDRLWHFRRPPERLGSVQDVVRHLYHPS